MSSIFIDPADGSDSPGNGAIGDPYKTTQYAIESETGVSWPVYFNIKSSAADVLTGDLKTSMATFHSNNNTNGSDRQVIFRGYDSTENDGGKGILDGDGSYSIFYDDRSGADFRHTHFLDLELRNTGSNDVIRTSHYCTIARCIIHNCAGTYGIYTYPYSSVTDCYFYDCDTSYMAFAYNVFGCFCYSFLPNDTSTCIRARNGCCNNIMVGDGTAFRGIRAYYDAEVWNNTIISLNNSSSYAIYFDYYRGCAVNNLIVGFSNGGTGIFGDEPESTYNIVGNSFYNCTTTVGEDGSFNSYDLQNETLASDPLMRVGDPIYENRFNYFEPLNVGKVWGGSYPWGCRRDRGAVQHKDNVYVVF